MNINGHHFSTVQFVALEEMGKKEMPVRQKSSFIYIDGIGQNDYRVMWYQEQQIARC